jgi:hypothetical protein
MGLGIGIMQSQPPTLGFIQVRLDIVISASFKAKLQFQQTNYYQLFFAFVGMQRRAMCIAYQQNVSPP